MIQRAVAIAGAILASGAVAAYWAYTLAGVTALMPVLRRPRQLAVGLASVLLVAGALPLDGGRMDGVALGLAAVGLALVKYAVDRQWLLPRPAAAFEPTAASPAAGSLVAVLDSGDAVPLAHLARVRTASVGEMVIVHCALAQSLAGFRTPPGGPVAAVLPHGSGFFVGNAAGTWDGVDGRGRAGVADLEPVPIGLMSVGAWRQRHPAGRLLAPVGDPPMPADRARRAMVPGARGVPEGGSLGWVVDGGWSPIEQPPRREPGPGFCLARWAAVRRGLTRPG